MGFDEARLLLSRTAFGVTPAEIRALEVHDYAAAVDRLLEPAPARGDDTGAGLARPGARPSCGASSRRPRPQRKHGVDGKPLQIVRPVQEQGRELRNWWVEEMLVTDQPLVERMTLFWHGHFTSSLMKVRYPRRRCFGRTRCSDARRWATSRPS